MRKLWAIPVLALATWFIWNRFIKPAPPPPPPPPPIAQPVPPTPALRPEDVAKVIESTKDMDPNVRWEAVKLLAEVNAPQANARLYEMLARDAEASVRQKIVSLLENRRSPETTKRLVQALGDGEPEVRIAALEVLAKIGDFTTASAVSDVLKDTDERVRLQALKTLNALQKQRAEEIRQQEEQAHRQAAAAAKK